MINPEELMLGNYIKFNGKETIVTINTFHVLANSCKRKLFEPIAISENEIESFGLEKTKIAWRDGSISEDVYRIQDIYFTFTEAGLAVSKLIPFLGKNEGSTIDFVNYVHQFQNYVYLLTQRKLTK